MDLLDSRQTGDSLGAEHQTKSEIRRIIEQLNVTEVSSKGGRKYPRRKIYMGLRNGCLRTEMSEKLRFFTLLSELYFYIQCGQKILPFQMLQSSKDSLGFQCSTAITNYNNICYTFKYFKANNRMWSIKDNYYSFYRHRTVFPVQSHKADSRDNSKLNKQECGGECGFPITRI